MPLLLLSAVGLLIGLFPWFATYQGALFDRPVSIRAVGDVLGGSFVLLGFFSFLSERLRNRLRLLADRIENLNTTHYFRLLIVLMLLFITGAISHKLRAYAMLSTHAFDLGFFSNICWNTSQGHWFFSSILERNFMGVHVNWILWPLSYLYRLWPDARVLLISQVLFMSSAIPVLVWMGYRQSQSRVVGLMCGLLFACSPFFLHTLFNDFHPDTWQLPFLMGALWAYNEKKPGLLLFLCALSLLAKEDVSVVLSGFAVFLIFQKDLRMTGVLLLVLALSVFFFHTFYFIPRFLDGTEESLLLTRYNLGSSFSEIIKNILTEPNLLISALINDPQKYWRFLNYFFPAAGLTFFSPFYLIPCVVSVLPHLLAQASTQLSLAEIYSLPSQPFVFVGALSGFLKIQQAKWFQVYRNRWIAFCFIVAGLGVLNSPRTFRTLSSQRQIAFKELKKLIPSQASVAAQQNLFPHFDARHNIQLFPIRISMPELQRRVLLNPDYVICDRVGNALPFDGPTLAMSLLEMESHPAYEKIYEEHYFVVFRRRVDEVHRWAPLS